MQFHRDGFQPGDPAVSPAPAVVRPDALPSEADVLIVGCGPAGLTLAAQLSAFPDIKTVIVEQKSGPLLKGQADGIACRTVEMFEAFGFSERVLKEACWINETTFWKPDPNNENHIARSGRVQDTEDGLSEFPHVVLNQARVHDFYLETMRNSPSRLEPYYNRQLIGLTVSNDTPASSNPLPHRVTATLEHIGDEKTAKTETIKARFVVGCDGARSVVRKNINRSLEGDSANHAWGVMDLLAVTDFPDVRFKSLIQSAHEGSVLIIPREGGYLFRLYIELDKLSPGERIAHRNLTPEHLIAAAKRIFTPCTLDVKEVVWWSVYDIGQRLCDKFDDVAQGETRLPSVFIAGDACHTHSPKAGQGMNVSMQDGFNLGWKLASVLRGRAAPELLHTYSAERQTIAKELIDFDREWAALFASHTGANPAQTQDYFVKHGRYTAGTATRYKPSIIVGDAKHQHLAKGFEIGMRFHSAPVIQLADAKPVQLGHAIKADGRWRLLAFGGKENPSEQSSAIWRLCEFLGGDESSPLKRYTPSGGDIDSVIDLRAVFQQDHRTLAIESLPPLLLPQKGRYKLRDYEKLFCADLKTGNDIFNMRGIDRVRGSVVIVRPDQYVAHVLPLDAHDELAALFDGFMIQSSLRGA